MATYNHHVQCITPVPHTQGLNEGHVCEQHRTYVYLLLQAIIVVLLHSPGIGQSRPLLWSLSWRMWGRWGGREGGKQRSQHLSAGTEHLALAANLVMYCWQWLQLEQPQAKEASVCAACNSSPILTRDCQCLTPR